MANGIKAIYPSSGSEKDFNWQRLFSGRDMISKQLKNSQLLQARTNVTAIPRSPSAPSYLLYADEFNCHHVDRAFTTTFRIERVQTYKCVMIMNPYRIGRGPGHQRPNSGVAQHGACPNYATAERSENQRRKRRGRQVKRRRKVWKGRCLLVRVDTLNIGTMTEKRRELADLME